MKQVFDSINVFLQRFGKYTFPFLIVSFLIFLVIFLRKKIINYLKESLAELKKVNWPNKERVIKLFEIVVVVSLVFIIYIGISDFVILKAISFIIGKL